MHYIPFQWRIVRTGVLVSGWVSDKLVLRKSTVCCIQHWFIDSIWAIGDTLSTFSYWLSTQHSIGNDGGLKLCIRGWTVGQWTYHWLVVLPFLSFTFLIEGNSFVLHLVRIELTAVLWVRNRCVFSLQTFSWPQSKLSVSILFWGLSEFCVDLNLAEIGQFK